jgi:hypothetical protein
MIKPKRPEIGTWKTNQQKRQGTFVKFKPTFDQLLHKYVNQKAVSLNRPQKKRPRSPMHDEGSSRSVFNRLSRGMQDRLSSWQSVQPAIQRSNLPRQVYRVKKTENIAPMQVDTPTSAEAYVAPEGKRDPGKRPVVESSSAKLVIDEEAKFNQGSGARKIDSKYMQPRWCPSGLTKTQKRRLQRLRDQEKKEKLAEEHREQVFNEIKPMQPIKKQWRPKVSKDSQPSTEITISEGPELKPEAPVFAGKMEVEVSSVPETSKDTPNEESVSEDEELVDYEPSPVHGSSDIDITRSS